MEVMWSASAQSKRDKKSLVAHVNRILVSALFGSVVSASPSEKIVEVPTTNGPALIHATGEMTLTVSWVKGDPDKAGAIDEESFSQIAKEIEEEMGRSNLAGTMYEEFALRIAERYIEEVEG